MNVFLVHVLVYRAIGIQGQHYGRHLLSQHVYFNITVM